MTMDKYLALTVVYGAMLCNVVLGESSEAVGGSLRAILNAQLLSSHNQPPATTKINHNVHIPNQVKKHLQGKLAHSTHIQSHGKAHLPGKITEKHPLSKGKEPLPEKIHHNAHIKNQGKEHIQEVKVTHNTHIQSPEVKHLPGKTMRSTHIQSQGKKHILGEMQHKTRIENQEKKNIPIPVQSEKHTQRMNHENTRAVHLDHNAALGPSNPNSQPKNKTVPQIENVKQQLLAKSKEAQTNPQSNTNDMNAGKLIEEEALNIPVTIRIMFPHYIQVKNKWYPLKLRFGVPQP